MVQFTYLCCEINLFLDWVCFKFSWLALLCLNFWAKQNAQAETENKQAEAEKATKQAAKAKKEEANTKREAMLYKPL